MTTVKDILIKYHARLDYLDLELIIAHELKKSREFVLAHPELIITKKQETLITKLIRRRIKHEPLAYILGHKEFFGLDFKVNQHTLVPRPETELLVELALQELQNTNHKLLASIIDIGTGSGNIIITLAKSLTFDVQKGHRMSFYGVDISKDSLKIAKYNAKKHRQPKIKFLRGDLLNPILNNTKYIIPDAKYIILANLPYLSQEIYTATAPTVKKYEPKSALYSAQDGLAHCEKLLKQIKQLATNRQLQTTNFFEISPEQKPKLHKLIEAYLPQAKIEFFKDLAGKWRVCKINTLSS